MRRSSQGGPPGAPESADRMPPLPPHPLIVFDGECVLCSRGARFVLAHDRAGRFRLTPAQGPLGRSLYRALGLPDDELGTMLLVERGRVLTESEAVLGIAAGLGWPWRAAGLARLVPRPVRDALYRLVARNRFRWFGRRAACWRPAPGMADRIL